jgi:hypothetical protein
LRFLFTFNPFRVVLIFDISPRFHLGLFTFNPFGVVVLEVIYNPRFHLGLFTFNPFGVTTFEFSMYGLFDKHKNSMKNGEAKKLPVNSLDLSPPFRNWDNYFFGIALKGAY